MLHTYQIKASQGPSRSVSSKLRHIGLALDALHFLLSFASGRVGVVGGSADYCGAPYFSSMASMRIVRPT